MEQIDLFELTQERFKFKHRPIKLFEAFAGIGCQAMALKRLGVVYESIGISEIDKYAIKSYMAIHGETKNYGDICKMEEIPRCDIFTYSFPCTDLSKAGQRKGMTKDTRSGLVYEVLRLVRNTKEKPKVLIMENVPDLVQAKFYKQFHEIMNELESYGYSNYVKRLNAKHYGVAQNRDRVFMVSILGKYSYKFPKPIKLQKRLKDYLEENVDEKYYLSDKMIKFFYQNSEKNKAKGNGFRFKPHEKPKDEIARALTTHPSNARMDDNFIKEGMVIGNTQKNCHKGNVEEECPCLTSAMGMGGGHVPMLTEPKVEQVANIVKTGNFDNPQRGRIYSEKGISPALNCVGGGGLEPKIVIPENTKKGYAEARDGDGVYLNRPHQKRGVVQKKKKIPTLKTSGDDIGVVVNPLKGKTDYGWHFEQQVYNENGIARAVKAGDGSGNIPKILTPLRIRKLTPKECWRLMGINDQDFEKAQSVCSNSQLYKQAGNGIVVDVFAAILKGLF